MVSANRTLVIICAVIFCAAGLAMANPAFAGLDFLGVCIRNCAQCKKMFGSYFDGATCADACVRFKGKIVPDCEDLSSIQPFLTKYE